MNLPDKFRLLFQGKKHYKVFFITTTGDLEYLVISKSQMEYKRNEKTYLIPQNKELFFKDKKQECFLASENQSEPVSWNRSGTDPALVTHYEKLKILQSLFVEDSLSSWLMKNWLWIAIVVGGIVIVVVYLQNNKPEEAAQVAGNVVRVVNPQ